MFLCGTIKVKGPEFEKKDITFESKVAGEFYLEMDKAAVPVVDDFSIWISIDDDKEIKISARDLDDTDLINNYILVRLEGNGGHIELALSPEQAAALSELLQHYATAHDEAKALRTEQVVKSA